MERQLMLLMTTLVSTCWAVTLPSSYTDNQQVPVYANKVGPFANPSETYEFYDMPFCKPDSVQYMDQDIGQMLRGDRFVNTLYGIKFQGTIRNKRICRKELTAADTKKLLH